MEMDETVQLVAAEVDIFGTNATTGEKQRIGKIAAVIGNASVPQVLMESLERLTPEDISYMTDLNIHVWNITPDEAKIFADKVRAENPDAETEGDL